MKQMIARFVVFLLAIQLYACSVSRNPYGDPGKCEIHGLSLHKSLVRKTYGFCCSPRTHLGIGSENFPNARHPVCGGCSVREPFTYIYNCSECNRARRKYVFVHRNDPERKVRAMF